MKFNKDDFEDAFENTKKRYGELKDVEIKLKFSSPFLLCVLLLN